MLDSIPLTINDLINAAFWAVLIVVVIRLLGWAFRKVISRSRHILFDPAKLEDVRKVCRLHYPIEDLQFNGATFKRGTLIRVVTHEQTFFEGEFLGTNRSNVMCLVTQESIVSQELHAIEAIQVIGKPAGV
jgi:hypothetical protein